MAKSKPRIKRARKPKEGTKAVVAEAVPDDELEAARDKVAAAVPHLATTAEDDHRRHAAQTIEALLAELGRLYQLPKRQRRLRTLINAVQRCLRDLPAGLQDLRDVWKSPLDANDEAADLARRLDGLLADELAQQMANARLLKALKAYDKLGPADRAKTAHPRPGWEHLPLAAQVYMLGAPVVAGGQPFQQMFAMTCLAEGLGSDEAAILAGIFGETILAKAPRSTPLPASLAYFRDEESAVKAWQKVFSQDLDAGVANARPASSTGKTAVPGGESPSPEDRHPGE